VQALTRGSATSSPEAVLAAVEAVVITASQSAKKPAPAGPVTAAQRAASSATDTLAVSVQRGYSNSAQVPKNSAFYKLTPDTSLEVPVRVF